MIVLGLQGSPRKRGNTEALLSAFLKEAARRSADVLMLNPSQMKIEPCRGCRSCEKSGLCEIADDDMSCIVYPELRKADLIVIAAPVYFYGMPSQLKALIDRGQALWARKYILGLNDPGSKHRIGFLLSVGARGDEHLFNGINQTAKYFFNTVGASYKGCLTYNHIENAGVIQNHPSAFDDARKKAAELVEPLLKRKKLIFICGRNAGRSQMAAAFAQVHAGGRFEILSGGCNPARAVSSVMQHVMAEKGIDMAFRKPMSAESALGGASADFAVTMESGISCQALSGAEIIKWDIPDPKGRPIEFLRGLRDDIEKKVIDLFGRL